MALLVASGMMRAYAGCRGERSSPIVFSPREVSRRERRPMKRQARIRAERRVRFKGMFKRVDVEEVNVDSGEEAFSQRWRLSGTYDGVH